MTVPLVAVRAIRSRAPRQLARSFLASCYNQSVRSLATVEKTRPIGNQGQDILGASPNASRPNRSPGLDSEAFHPLPQALKTNSSPEAPKLIDGALYIPGQTGWYKASGRWLRDICPCPQCRNQDTSQRQINVLKLGSACEVASATQTPSGFNITFADGHETAFTPSALTSKANPSLRRKRTGTTPLTPWNATISTNPPETPYSTLSTPAGMAHLMTSLRTHGFAFISSMPPTPEATETLLLSLGPIRNTHYGGFYDFTSDLSLKDTAYTSEFLEPHTDNTYFTEPAGLQALHLLEHSKGSGGESSLVDGFGAAMKLWEEDREAYRVLAMTGVWGHASGNEGISIQPSQAYPVLGHSQSLSEVDGPPYLVQVRWNNADRAGVEAEGEALERWYDAAAKFDRLLCAEKNAYWFQLKPGKMLLFDNWRVLHGRAEFTGKRRMCGGYINRDDYISKFRMATLSEDDIRGSTVTG